MVYRYESFRDNKGIVVIQFLKVSHLSIIPNRFYETPKLKNWMCELCTFSQIQSHITKQLEYVTKDHIAMHTLLFTLKTALFFSYLVV